jgi:hypothetical protein
VEEPVLVEVPERCERCGERLQRETRVVRAGCATSASVGRAGSLWRSLVKGWSPTTTLSVRTCARGRRLGLSARRGCACSRSVRVRRGA